MRNLQQAQNDIRLLLLETEVAIQITQTNA